MMMEVLKNKTVLIVDDDAGNGFALRSYLEALDMETAIAENGEEAIFILQNSAISNIILLDMMMPIMDGYENALRLKTGYIFKTNSCDRRNGKGHERRQ